MDSFFLLAVFLSNACCAVGTAVLQALILSFVRHCISECATKFLVSKAVFYPVQVSPFEFRPCDKPQAQLS